MCGVCSCGLRTDAVKQDMSNTKTLITEIVLLLILLFLLFRGIYIIDKYSFMILKDNDQKVGKVCFEENCFQVELAVSDQQRSRGLMLRESLGEDQGMLFVFEKEGNYNFWMKNTFIPLDIIWINGEKKVVFIKESVQSCKDADCPSINPGTEAKYVLELNSGKSKEIGLAVDSQVSIEY
ncbi:MAG: hypothetical protein A3F15_02060 [Candidatus Wildermuthbacteria bacterium RIFCSPHIGHO2_12_FULL_40_12]|uniref:DUF192 domain-containing protein n=2 Tax=Candidatus Wildermuthiibacteriota TaxID=1817923 RepID=A0A1G2RDU2_9BACT|nr:MAG: hypothetical protein A3F15_02060 [Candidatus Wildermuthbacteria bacterium RIFCSPHIGHO2_12_FULL_40_12]